MLSVCFTIFEDHTCARNAGIIPFTLESPASSNILSNSGKSFLALGVSPTISYNTFRDSVGATGSGMALKPLSPTQQIVVGSPSQPLLKVAPVHVLGWRQ